MAKFINLLFPVLLVILQNGGISVESTVDRSEITIGDLVKYEIIIRRDKDIIVEKPGLASNLGYFEIRDYRVHEPVKTDGMIEERVEYIISTYDTGTYVIPPITISYMGTDSVRKELKTDEIKIRVESVKPSEAEDIKGLKPPSELERNVTRIILVSIAGFLFVVILILVYFIYRKKKKGESILPIKKKPEKPAHETALEALQRLKESKLLEEGKVKEYYIELSDIIRVYIAKRYFIPAMEMTTREIMKYFRKNEREENILPEIETFLHECDFVKFAKYIPASEEIDKTTDRALKIVEDTKIVLVVPPEEKEETEEGEKEIVEQMEEKEE